MSDWIRWPGGDCKPKELEGKCFDVRFREAGVIRYKPLQKARWTNTGHTHDIIAYRIVDNG